MGFLRWILGEYVLPIFMIVLAVVVLGAAGAIGKATWPIAPLFVGSAAVWWITRKSTAVWGKALAQVLLPITIGLAILAICLISLNIFGLAVGAEEIRAVELTLIQLKFTLKEWGTFSWLNFVAVLSAFVVLSYMIHGSGLVTRFLRMQSFVSGTIVVLTTLVSFSFFSQYPIGGWAAEEQDLRIGQSDTNVYHYTLLLREQRDSVAKYLAVKSLERALLTLQTSDRDTLVTFFQTIDRNAANLPTQIKLERSPFVAVENRILQRRIRNLVDEGKLKNPYGEGLTGPTLDLRNDVTESLVTRYVEEVVEKPIVREQFPRSGADKEYIERIARHSLAAEQIAQQPVSQLQWQEQSDLLAEQSRLLRQQQARTASQETETNELMTALTKMFSRTVSLGIPAMEGIAGVFLKKLVSAYSERIFKTVADRWIGRALDGSGSSIGFAEFAEATLPTNHVARQLLIPMIGNETKRSTIRRTLQAEMTAQVRAVAQELSLSTRERIGSRYMTLEEKAWLNSGRAKRRGISVYEATQKKLKELEKAKTVKETFKK